MSPLQPTKARLPMLVTLSGTVMLVKAPHPEKANSPMCVTLAGIVTLVRPVQPSNALSPMLVTLPSVGMTLVLQPKISVFVVVSIKQFLAL